MTEPESTKSVSLQVTHTLKDTLKELADLKFALDESAIVAITNASGVITEVNDTFCRISQYSRDELMGCTHRIINSGYHPRVYFKEMWDTIRQGCIWRGEVRNRAKDGSCYWVDTTIVPFLDDTGTPVRYIAIRYEISDRKRVEAELRQLNEEMEQRVHERTVELQAANLSLQEMLARLQESDQLRNTFVSTLTHDLRTPLVAQERALELFLDNRDVLSPRLAELANRLVSSNAGLLAMVNMLLETYQYESDTIQLHWASLSLRDLVIQCMGEVAALADARGIHLGHDIPVTFPAIPGDAYQLKRVLMNLLGNALENIPSGSQIRISATEETDCIWLTLEDTGPGIAPDDLPHLFERYYTGKQGRLKKIGTGLGLYICRMIMEQHHGAIAVESQPAQGARFTLMLLKQPPSIKDMLPPCPPYVC
jgi:PAS domain S-box-containing protein